jgi:hypothetical protein
MLVHAMGRTHDGSSIQLPNDANISLMEAAMVTATDSLHYRAVLMLADVEMVHHWSAVPILVKDLIVLPIQLLCVKLINVSIPPV